MTEAPLAEIERRFVTTSGPVEVGDWRPDILRPRNSDDLIREEDYVKDERLPYWADIWPSSLILAGRVREERGAGRRALELGCGVGLVTLAALTAGYDVLATDYYDDALLFARANGLRNVAREPETRMVDWRHFPGDLGHFDLILASDVLYEKEYATLVARAIHLTLARGGKALIGDPGRIAAEEFVAQCGSLGLRVSSEVRPYEEGQIRQRITIYTVVR